VSAVDELMVQNNIDNKLINLFISIHQTQSAGTAKNYASAIREFMSYVAKPLNEVTLDDIVDYAKSISHMAVATQKRKLSAIKSLYNWIMATQPGYLRVNPMNGFKMPKMEKSNTINRFLTESEVRRLLELIRYRNYRNYLVVYTLYATGARVSEILNARWCDLYRDLDGDIGLTIVGKGNKRREVAIPANLFRLISEYRKREGLPHLIGDNDTGPIFPNRNGQPMTARYIEQELSKVAQMMGKKFTPHWLRHSHITHALHNGASIYQAQRQAGHASIKTTEIYVHTVNRLKESTTKYLNTDDM
jgi:integrase/recombinase XerD